jgi:hypothetical protein
LSNCKLFIFLFKAHEGNGEVRKEKHTVVHLGVHSQNIKHKREKRKKEAEQQKEKKCISFALKAVDRLFFRMEAPFTFLVGTGK